ncbi:hypothetical protein NPIL_101241 [Nephila pilipes]|uniref:Uncharacterized protein n=1 Tax=Nephila pilipes TaxID=299642 RepID=A0A8X6NQ37_NEPPI|nr:hypothetical protein NPIL_101241 [Nephila pilipes]
MKQIASEEFPEIASFFKNDPKLQITEEERLLRIQTEQKENYRVPGTTPAVTARERSRDLHRVSLPTRASKNLVITVISASGG